MNKDLFEKKIWLSTPFMHGEEQAYVSGAFKSNWITTAGENIDALEETICEYTGSRYAVALSSGTAALHLALVEAGVGAGDTVFCSDVTFVASANPIIYQGAKPVFIDSEKDTWNMDPKALEEAFEKYPEAKAVISVNLYGIPAKLDEIKNICKKYSAVLIEDSAESLGAAYKGKQTGTWGDYGIFSFNGNKIITGSTGGIILTDNEESAKHIKKLSTQAKEPCQWYQHEETGYNYRMSNIVAGVVRGQMKHLDEHIYGKKEIFNRYCEGFACLPLKMHGGGNYWLSCMTIDEECPVTPDDVMHRLAENNIEARRIWKPMSMQPLYKDSPVIGSKTSHEIFDKGLCFPSDLNMSEDEQAEVIELVKGCFGQ